MTTATATSAIPGLFAELHQTREHAHHARYLLLPVHGRRIGHVTLEIQGDALRHKRQNGEQIVVVSAPAQLVTQRLNKPRAFGCVTPWVEACQKIKMFQV